MTSKEVEKEVVIQDYTEYVTGIGVVIGALALSVTAYIVGGWYAPQQPKPSPRVEISEAYLQQFSCESVDREFYDDEVKKVTACEALLTKDQMKKLHPNEISSNAVWIRNSDGSITLDGSSGTTAR